MPCSQSIEPLSDPYWKLRRKKNVIKTNKKMTIWRLFTQSVCTGFFLSIRTTEFINWESGLEGERCLRCLPFNALLHSSLFHIIYPTGRWGDYSVLHARFRLMVEQPWSELSVTFQERMTWTFSFSQDGYLSDCWDPLSNRWATIKFLRG